MNLYVDWHCPSCGLTERTGNVPNRFHNCARMNGLTTPLVRAGVKANLVRVDRQDYAGNDILARDDEGRPVMAIRTIRDDGEDVTVFAPTAVAKGEASGVVG